MEYYKGRIFWPANEGLPSEEVGFGYRTWGVVVVKNEEVMRELHRAMDEDKGVPHQL